MHVEVAEARQLFNMLYFARLSVYEVRSVCRILPLTLSTSCLHCMLQMFTQVYKGCGKSSMAVVTLWLFWMRMCAMA